jgi:hypothetical protein
VACLSKMSDHPRHWRPGRDARRQSRTSGFGQPTTQQRRRHPSRYRGQAFQSSPLRGRGADRDRNRSQSRNRNRERGRDRAAREPPVQADDHDDDFGTASEHLQRLYDARHLIELKILNTEIGCEHQLQEMERDSRSRRYADRSTLVNI